MFQYLTMNRDKILDKNGNDVYVKGFRKRIDYMDNMVYIAKMKEEILNRPDIIVKDLYGSVTKLSGIIDTNDKDIFSFRPNDNYNYASKMLAI